MVHLSSPCSRSVHILLVLLFFFSILLLTSSTSMEVAFSDARRLPVKPQPQDRDTGGANKANNKQQEAAARSRGRRALIGSRPPRCERVCISCGHCEAVQVPIVPLPQQEATKARAATSAAAAADVTLTAAMFTYRVDGITNYKPLSWKCRCGGTILDP